jgi:uncharacterized protein (TIGR02145 family)
MKKLFTLIASIIISINLFSQAPQKMSYQAVIRNASNELLVNKPVKMRISILQGSATGSSVYSELHSATTNANGLVSIEIGGGTSPTGIFSSINWGNGTYFVKTETDPNNGTNYTITGTTQLLSVPFSLHANCVSSFVSGDTLTIGCKQFLLPGVIDITEAGSHSCGAKNIHNPMNKYGTIIDIDGNKYKTIQIGDQIWMAENLNTTKYNNGTPIEYITSNIDWGKNMTGAYCNYNNNLSDCPNGKLYNWYAATNTNKICPTGWHLPTKFDWNKLIKTIDPSADTTCTNCFPTSNGGGKMKSVGLAYWRIPNLGATNSSGFGGLPSGYRHQGGVFDSLGDLAYWWSASEVNSTIADYYYLWSQEGYIDLNGSPKSFGYSIRCVKDQ